MPFDGLVSWHRYINAHAALHEQQVFALQELCSRVRENEQKKLFSVIGERSHQCLSPYSENKRAAACVQDKRREKRVK